MLPFAALVLALGCGDSGVTPAAEPETLVVESFYLGLDGRGDSWPDDRATAAAEELRESPDDVLCVTGAWGPDARAALRSGLGDVFPFAVELPTTSATAPTDPTDGAGGVPEARLDPPCGEPRRLAVSNVVACASSACSTYPRGPDAKLASTRCFQDFCTEKIDLLEDPADPHQRCQSCVLSQIETGAPFEAVFAACEDVPGDPFAYGGDSGLLVLSRLPVKSAALAVFPSAVLRRAAIHAVVTTERGTDVDVTCATLGPTGALGIPPEPSTARPYPGVYGTADDGWASEHTLQVDQLLAFEATSARSSVGLVMGLFGDSPGFTRDGEVVVAEVGDASAAQLATTFGEPLPGGVEPRCTVCPENALAPDGAAPTWPNRTYARGDRAHITSAVRTYLGRVVPVDPGFNGGFVVDRVPLSVAYGQRVTIELDAP